MLKIIKSNLLLYKSIIYIRYTVNLRYIIGMFSSNMTKLSKYKDNKSNKIYIISNTIKDDEDILFSEA